MKFSVLAALVAGAALVQVGASPLRVEIITPTQEFTPIRYGHAAAPAGNNNGNINPAVATLVRPHMVDHNKTPCKGMRRRLRQKALAISNAFRQAMGLPIIQNLEFPEDGTVHILSIGPPRFVSLNLEGPNGELPPPAAHPHPHHHHHHGGHRHVRHFYHRLADAPFLKRIHVALMTLGPWEGRAVAFVLGCGLGVLLRMFWVLSVVSYRLIRGTNNEETNTYTPIFLVEEMPDAIEVVTPTTAPPAYPEEKADKDEAN